MRGVCRLICRCWHVSVRRSRNRCLSTDGGLPGSPYMALPRPRSPAHPFSMRILLAALGIALASATANADDNNVAASGAMDVQHYGLDLHVDPQSKSLRGVVAIRAQLLSSTPTTLSLD